MGDPGKPDAGPCPSLEAIAEYLDAEASDADLEIAAHLRSCATCRDVVGVANVTAGPHGRAGPEIDAPVETPGRYALLRLLGRGGQALVWAARDHALDREVAFKELRQDEHHATTPAARLRFLWSARVAARLAHPSILAVYDLGVRENGAPFHTMPIVEGKTLTAAIADADRLEQRLALLPHILDACNAVAFAHEHGVLHRDINPANVMVGRFGETALIDWGLAIEVEEDPATDQPDRAERVVGTPAFLSPEQARGAASDVRTDVWGLGGLLYFVVTGQPLHPAEQLDRLLARARRGEHEAVEARCPDVPPELAAVIDLALASDPSQRYARVEHLAGDLGAFIRGREVSAYRYTWIRRARRFAAQHRPLVVATIVTLAVSLAAAALTSWAYQRERSANRAWQTAAREAELAELAAKQQRDESALHLALAHEAAARRLASDGLLIESALHALAALESVTSTKSNAARREALRAKAIAATQRASVRPLRQVTWRRDAGLGPAFEPELVRLSPDSTRLAVATTTGTIEFSSWAEGQRDGGFELASGVPLDVTWLDDERLVLAVPDAVEILRQDGELLQRWALPETDERRVFYRADAGEILAVDPRAVLVMKLGSPGIHELPFTHRLLRTSELLADGDTLVVATADQRLLVWDAQAREITRIIELPRMANVLSASPNGDLAIAGSGGWLYRVDLQNGESRKYPSGYADGVTAVTWLGDDMALALTTHGQADVFNAANGAPLVRTRQAPGAQAVLVATDAHVLIAAGGEMTRWSMALDWRGPVDFAVSDAVELPTLTSVSCARQGEHVLLGTRGRLHVLDRERHESYEITDAPVESAERSPFGDLVAAAGRTVWLRTASGQTRRHLLAGIARSARLSADGTRYAAISSPNTVVVWSTKTGKEVARIGFDSALASLALSPEGRLVAASGLGMSVDLHEVESGTRRARFGPTSTWSKLEFLDGETLLAAGDAGVVRMDLVTREAGVAPDPVILHPVSDLYKRLSASDDGRLVVADGLAQAALINVETGQSFTLVDGKGYCLLGGGDLLVADENLNLRRRSTDYAMRAFDARAAQRELETSLRASIGEFEIEPSSR